MSVTPERIAELRARADDARVRTWRTIHTNDEMLEVLDALTAAQAVEKATRELAIEDMQEMWGKLDAAKAEIAHLRDALAAETEALEIALKAVADTHAYWDADQDSKVGKTLIALLDPTLRYRADISRMHAIRARKAAP